MMLSKSNVSSEDAYNLLSNIFGARVSMAAVHVCGVAEITNDGFKIMVDLLKKLQTEEQQLDFINTVRDRFYQQVADKILP